MTVVGKVVSKDRRGEKQMGCRDSKAMTRPQGVTEAVDVRRAVHHMKALMSGLIAQPPDFCLSPFSFFFFLFSGFLAFLFCNFFFPSVCGSMRIWPDHSSG